MDLGRGTGQGELAALHCRKPLADGVDLDDIRAAGQKLGGDILQFLPGNQGLFKQGTAAAGQEEQHGVLLCQIGNQIQGYLGGGEAVFIGNGMPGFITGNAVDGRFHMAVFGDDNSCADAASQNLPGGICHLPCGFSRSHKDHPPGERFAAQGPLHSRVRQYGRNGSGNDLIGMFS